MFCCSVSFLLGTAFLFVGLSYIMYIPLSDEIGDQTQVRYFLVKFRAMGIVATIGEMFGWDSSLNITRKMIGSLLGNSLPRQIDGVKSEDLTFDGTPVRLYRPESVASPSPCVIYIHGGGWTVQNVDGYDEVAGDIAVKTGYIVVSIEYRLSPENPFPIPFDDCYKASLYLLQHASKYGIDGERVAIAGDSAGGNLAAAVSLKLSEVKNIPQFRFQWLIYPALQAFTFKLPSYITNRKVTPYFMQTVDMITSWCNYMGVSLTPDIVEKFQTDNHTSKELKQSKYAGYVDYKMLPARYHDVIIQQPGRNTGDEDLSKEIENVLLNPYFSPLMKANLSKVPPAFIVTAEYDVIRDDGLLYAERMRRDDVEVDVYHAPDSIHGYMFWSTSVSKFSVYDEVMDMFVKYANRHM